MPSDVLSWSRGTLQRLYHCPACQAPVRGAAAWARQDDYRLMPDQWHIHRCNSCGSIYLNPRPDALSLSAAYTDYLTHEIAGDEKIFVSNSLQWALVRDYLKWRFGLKIQLRSTFGGRWLFRLFEPWRLKLDRFGRNLTRKNFPEAGRVLDLGCGAGDFLLLARMMGWDAWGCDPDPEVVALCRSRGLNVQLGGAESLLASGVQFDAITLNQVIEHVLDPQSVVNYCFQLLKPGGMLWLGFPNPRALGCAVFGPAWAGLHPPYHVCLPTQSIVKHWLAGAGFERVRFKRRGAHTHANWRNSIKLAKGMRVVRPSGMRLRLGELLDNALATFTPNWAEETVAVAWKPVSGSEQRPIEVSKPDCF